MQEEKSDEEEEDDHEEKLKTNNETEPFYLIEFYNVVSLPAIFFEKAIPIFDVCLESLVWYNNKVFASCNNGSVIVCSPFSTKTMVNIS